MPSQLDAKALHTHLCTALAALRKAEGNAVALFAEVLRRRLYRDLGYASIHLYAHEALGFSRSKTYEFIRLSEALDRLPGLKAGVKSGELTWTKAREVVKVATPETEGRWLEMAEKKSRRELEQEIAKSRARRDRAKASPGQTELLKPNLVGPDRRGLSEAEGAQIDCDTKVLEPGHRNRQSIPPARRRAILIRDDHRAEPEAVTRHASWKFIT